MIAITIPTTPKILPNLEDSGCDKPLKANMNKSADNKYKTATIFADINLTFVFFFRFFLKHRQHSISNNKTTKNINRS